MLAVSAAGCGGPSKEERAAEAQRLQRAEEQGQEARENAEHAAAHQQCSSQLKDFLDGVRSIDSRLDVGLNFQAYSDAVGDAKVAYDEVAYDDLQPGCIGGVYDPASSALDRYITAYNTWNDCFSNTECSTDAIEPELQRHWSKASASLDEADVGLEALRSTGAVSDVESAEPSRSTAYAKVIVEKFCGTDPVTDAAKDACKKLRLFLQDGSVSSAERPRVESVIEKLDNQAFG